MPDAEPNVLYYGDNLDVLRRHVKDETVDLMYLDPPFKSNANYNVLFGENGEHPAAQIQAFEDIPDSMFEGRSRDPGKVDAARATTTP